MAHYEKHNEVLRVLQRRGWTVEVETVVKVMEQLDLRFPLGEAESGWAHLRIPT
jgi:hypothetical protein